MAGRPRSNTGGVGSRSTAHSRAQASVGPPMKVTITRSHVYPSSSMRLSIYNWRKYSRKEHTGLMGRVILPLDFLRQRVAHQEYNESLEVLYDGEAAGTIYVTFEIVREQKQPLFFGHSNTSSHCPQRAGTSSRSNSLRRRSGGSIEPASATSSATVSAIASETASPASTASFNASRSEIMRATGRSSHGTPRRRSRPQPSAHTLQLLRESLPTGWEARLSPGGEVYYANHITRTTQWQKPTEEAEASVDEAQNASIRRLESYERRSLLVSDLDVQQDDDNFGFPDEIGSPVSTPPTRPLPRSVSTIMEQAESPAPSLDDSVVELSEPRSPAALAPSSSFESNPTTPTTTPPHRRSRLVSGSPNPLSRHWSEFVVEDAQGEFPIGWEQRFTASGRPYYVDHINRSTTFTDPRQEAERRRREEALSQEAQLPQYKRDLRRKLLKLRHLVHHKQDKDAQKYGVRLSDREYRMEGTEIRVRRDHLFEDSFDTITKMTSVQLR
ncbi:uncharacterized protein MONBRDRAFT_39019, partial [Monosiga brevicollis MX1]